MKSIQVYIINALLLFLIISLAGLSIIYNYQQVITYAIIPFTLCIGLSLNKFRFTAFRSIYMRCFLVILILGILISPESKDMSVALENIITLTGVLCCILITIEFLSYQQHDFTECLLVSFVIGFMVLQYFLFQNISINNIQASSQYIDRSQFDINANAYSYFSYFANIALFYLIHLKRRVVYIVLSFVCLTIGVYISFFTASRSGISFTILIGCVYWLFIFDRLKINKTLRFIVTLLLLIIAANYLLNVYSDSFLKMRNDQSEDSGDIRTKLFNEAIDVFAAHPVTGVGPGQFYLYSSGQNLFSHNSFTEMAANFGFIGLLALLVLYFRPLIKEIFNRNTIDTTVKKLNILFFISFILINNIYVFYLTTYGMMFFFIVLMIQRKNFRSNATK